MKFLSGLANVRDILRKYCCIFARKYYFPGFRIHLTLIHQRSWNQLSQGWNPIIFILARSKKKPNIPSSKICSNWLLWCWRCLPTGGGMPEDTLITLVVHVSIFIFTLTLMIILLQCVYLLCSFLQWTLISILSGRSQEEMYLRRALQLWRPPRVHQQEHEEAPQEERPLYQVISDMRHGGQDYQITIGSLLYAVVNA